MKGLGRVLLSAVMLVCVACVTVGKDFPADPARKIVNGTTTREQVLATFGEPYQKGIDNGKQSWTYYRVRYRGTSEVESKELYVVFDAAGVVESHSFTSTAP